MIIVKIIMFPYSILIGQIPRVTEFRLIFLSLTLQDYAI